MVNSNGDTKKRSKGRSERAPTPIRVTSGVGFDHEDRVAALLLVTALVGGRFPGILSAPAEMLQAQVGSLGWKLDDLLLTTQDDGSVKRLSVSCKDNIQVTATALPADFLEAAWQQWADEAGPMENSDFMMLATGLQNPDFVRLWADLCDSVIAEEQQALSRIRSSRKQDALFDQIRRVGKKFKLGLNDSEVLAFTRSLVVQAYDFHLPNSSHENQAILQCRQLLDPSDSERAPDLWLKIVRTCTDARTRYGTIRVDTLWSQLGASFRLRDRWDVAQGRKVVREWSQEARSFVETALPGGVRIQRTDLLEALRVKMRAGDVLVVHGDSGCGKSALVETAVNELTGKCEIVWLSPENAATLMNAAGRAQLQMGTTLPKLLVASPKPDGILVLDSAERLSAAHVTSIGAVLRDSGIGSSELKGARWRVVLVCQQDALDDGSFSALLSRDSVEFMEVESLSLPEVSDALSQTGSLRWLATYPDALGVLSNVRTLGWAIAAASEFSGDGGKGRSWSRTGVIDRIWKKWTDGQLASHQLLVNLATIEAENLERGKPISELLSSEVIAFDQRQQYLPLRELQNRLVFTHDLAAEWARFERLQEIGEQPDAVARIAANPLWAGAVRLLGESLLRTQCRDGENAWNSMFRALENGRTTGHIAAADLLLDALYLDPKAFQFLDQRSAFLLGQDGSRLKRLLNRFLHAATMPMSLGSAVTDNAENWMRLHLEATMRHPIVGRWLGVALFLAARANEVGELISPAVARVSHMWLTRVPVRAVDGTNVPLRREFATVALATARALQTAKLQDVPFMDGSERPIYEAALAGASDLTEDVAAWALECAGRRMPNDKVLKAVQAHRESQAQERRRRNENDPASGRERQRRKAMLAATVLPSSRRLPAWPLGPQFPSDREFRKYCVSGSALVPVMGADGIVASELFLACAIESDPKEDLNRHHRMHDAFGMEYGNAGYPTTYWKSPVFSFLQIDRGNALSCMLKLVEFCTQRWTAETGTGSIQLVLKDGLSRTYYGDSEVLRWSQTSSHFAGTLYCATAALEKWLYMEVDAGRELDHTIHWLLQNSNSVAILGVLLNLGKYRPQLLTGSLRPLVGSVELHMWDMQRAQTMGTDATFDPYAWVREGEFAFRQAKDWHFAPHRQVSLTATVVDLVRVDAEVASFVRDVSAAWPIPDSGAAALRLRMLQAELDAANHVRKQDDAASFEFVLPSDIRAAIEDFQAKRPVGSMASHLPWQCRRALDTGGTLTDESANFLGAFLLEHADEAVAGNSPDDDVADAVIAAACTLRSLGSEWLRAHQDVVTAVEAVIVAQAEALNEESLTELSGQMRRNDNLAYFLSNVASVMLVDPGPMDAVTHRLVMSVLTSGDRQGGRAFFEQIHNRRMQLGEALWGRVVNLGVLWAGLSPLRHGREGRDLAVWKSWVLRFQKLPLEVKREHVLIEPDELARRASRLYRRCVDRQPPHPLFGRPRWRFSGLNHDVLLNIFSWVLQPRSSELVDVADAVSTASVVQMLIRYELRHDHDDEEEFEEVKASTASGEAAVVEFKPKEAPERRPSSFGYAALHAAAQLLPSLSAANAAAVWQPILDLGPPGRLVIRTFFDAFVSLLAKTPSLHTAAGHWQNMIDFALSAWSSASPWYHRESLLGALLGFGQERLLDERPEISALVTGMRPLYERWAAAHLKGHEDNVARLSVFLSARTGAGLRVAGLRWLDESLHEGAQGVRWHRDDAPAALVDLLDAILQSEVAVLKADRQVRDSYLRLLNLLVIRQRPAAMALQEAVARAFAG